MILVKQTFKIYCRKQKVIRLEKTSIGEYSFDKIVSEFRQIKSLG